MARVIPPKIATIFISAHSMEDPKNNIKIPASMEVRNMNSQLLCGRSNFENAESIQNKLHYWTDLFNDRSKRDSTYSVLEKGVREWNALEEPYAPSLAESIRLPRRNAEFEHDLGRFSSIYHEKGSSGLKKFYTDSEFMARKQYYTQLLRAMNQVISSGEDLHLFYHYLGINEDELPRVQAILDATSYVEPWISMYQLTQMGIELSYIVNALLRWKSTIMNEREGHDTNLSSIQPVLFEKEYIFAGNPGEDPQEVRDSFYGIHLIQDSEDQTSIYQYPEGDHTITYDNAIAGISYYLPEIYRSEPTDYIEFKPRNVSKMTDFMKKALMHFSDLLRRSLASGYKYCIRLSEIIDFFYQNGYTVLNIIDTGCRNVNIELFPAEVYSNVEMEDMYRNAAIRTKKRLSEAPFRQQLGRRSRTKSGSKQKRNRRKTTSPRKKWKR